MDEIKILLEKNFILKEEQRELYYSIKDHYKQIKPFIVDKLGYELIIRSDFIRLEKRPGKAESWMGIKEFEDKQAYVFFMLLYAFYGSKIRSMVNLFRIGKSDSHVLKLLKRLRKLGPVDKPRYYDNDVIRVIYKPEKKKNT